MVRKQAIKRLIWQAILFVVSSAIFKTIWAGVIIIYLLRAIGLGTEIQSEEYTGYRRTAAEDQRIYESAADLDRKHFPVSRRYWCNEYHVGICYRTNQ